MFWLLVVANLGGAVPGFLFWYGDLLTDIPWYVWPLVPDSPLAVTFMGVALIALRYGRLCDTLGLVASGTCIKYGLWTDFAWFTNYLSGGEYDFTAVLMSLTHLGMVIEGFILGTFLRFRLGGVAIASLFLILNDVADYGFGYHPPLPNPENIGAVRCFSVGTTLAIVLFCIGTAWVLSRKSQGDADEAARGI